MSGPGAGPVHTALSLITSFGRGHAGRSYDRAGSAVRAAEATGGPDAFGYTYADGNEASCSFDWIDISATGTMIASGDDVSSGGVALTEDFDFYGIVYNSLNMATNGYISTDPTDAGPDLSNDCPLPSTPSTGGGARMYPVHDDLISDGYMEYFATCPRPNERCDALFGGPFAQGCTIFQWSDVTHFGGGGPFEMQAVLHHTTNDIVYQVGPGNPEAGAGSTTGLQNDGATIGLTYACDTAASVPDNSAVCISHPNDIQALGCYAPSVIEIPTADHRGLIALGVLLAFLGAGVLAMRRRRSTV